MVRYSEKLSYDWDFARGEIPNAKETDCSYTGWKQVRVPHDYAIEGPFDPVNDMGNTKVNADGFPVSNNAAGRTGALPLTGTAWYRRKFEVKPQWADKEISFEFDGVMSHCEVFVNGVQVGQNVYGYTTFRVDVTEAVRVGENLLAVRVNQLPWESRWYPGAGIYRNVRLTVKDKTSFAYNTVFLTTPQVEKDAATVAIVADIQNPTEGLSVHISVISPDGSQVAAADAPVTDGKLDAKLAVDAPKLWANETPNLYLAELTLCKGGEVLDNETVRFGIRTIAFDSEKGCLINGVVTKMNGVCMHHDLGAIGAAVNEAALRRQFKILADMGCNSIRTSHNPPAPELLNIADEMGFYIIVEQFDQWKTSKTENGYGLYFDMWADYDFTCTIRRDRNHPSVIMWSIGNEIPEQDQKDGAKVAKFLVDIAHREDPSRATTAGFNYDNGAHFHGLTDVVDVVGYNYRCTRYSLYHDIKHYSMYGSETESCVSSRGVYFIPDKKAADADEQAHTIEQMYDYPRRAWRRYPGVEIPAPIRENVQVNSYDLSAPRWAYYPEVEFAAQDDCPYVFGEYVWTGFDYLGEPTPYGMSALGAKLARSSYFGIIDLAGLPKDRFYSYQARWTNKAVLHPFPHWNWNEGDVLPVHCYASYDRAELFVNGKSYGICEKEPESDNCLKRYRLMWEDVQFEPGQYTVKALDKDGKVLAETTVRTAGAPAKLELSADRESYAADGDDLCYITVRVVDKDGNFCPMASTRLHFEVVGDGELIATDNGDATDLEVFSSCGRNAFSGMAVGIVRTVKDKPGSITVKVTGEGVSGAELTVAVK